MTLINNGTTLIGTTSSTTWLNTSINTNSYITYSDYSTSFDLNFQQEYSEFIAECLGLPSYNDFVNMSEEARKAYIRDRKIDDLLK